MQSLMNDFNTFFNSMLTCLSNLWSWIMDTVLGEILLFVIIISIFFFIMFLIVDLKN